MTGQEADLNVQCDMSSDGGGWTRVGRQQYPYSFSSKAEVSVNPNSPIGPLHLIMDRLEQLRGLHGEFK